ncbi:MAG: hypothetical protein HY892_21350 [Deltaproteobacteria bacterium]|nr:hypothetical protein [Deltaproteobacteria bacterium]
MNPIRLKGLVAGLLILWLLASACSREDDVVTLQALIKKGSALAEKHDIPGLLGLTSGDFTASPGGHDRQGVKGILGLAFRHYGPLRVLYPRPGIDLGPSKQRASGTVYFMIVKKELSYPGLEALYSNPRAWLAEAGENADLYRLKLEFKKTSGKWIVVSARLDPFRGLGFEPD